jgi:BRCT domain type II-containing protein
VETSNSTSSSEEEEGQNSVLDEIAEMERFDQVPFDNENGIDYMSDDSLQEPILVVNIY